MEADVRTIKGVDEETWKKFKTLAADQQITMSKLLRAMIEEYRKKRVNKFWESILHGEKLISDKEAEEMHAFTKKLRKEWGYRK